MHLHLLRALQADPTTTPPIHMRPGKGATALGVPVRGEINAEHAGISRLPAVYS